MKKNFSFKIVLFFAFFLFFSFVILSNAEAAPISRIMDPAAGSWLSNKENGNWFDVKDTCDVAPCTCFYKISHGGGFTVANASRICNSDWSFEVVKNNCPSNGVNTCTVIVYSKNADGIPSANHTRVYNTDWYVSAVIPGSTNPVLPLDGVGKRWAKNDFTVHIKYSDNPGGLTSSKVSKLSSCDYSVTSGSDPEVIISGAACSGAFETDRDQPVTVGIGKNCHEQGADMCKIKGITKDRAGNTYTTAEWKIAVDWEKPVIANLRPTSALFYTPTLLRADVTDNMEIQSCLFYIDTNNDGSYEYEAPADTEAGGTKMNRTIYTSYTFCAVGTKVYITCTDVAGNTETFSKTITPNNATLDTKGPDSIFEGDTPPEGAYIPVNSSFTAHILDNDSPPPTPPSGQGTAYYKILDHGSCVRGCDNKLTRPWGKSGNSSNFAITTGETGDISKDCTRTVFANGEALTCEIRVWSVDCAGNQGPTASRKFNIGEDTEIPKAEIISPAAGSWQKSPSLSAGFKFTDNGGLLKCEYLVQSFDDSGAVITPPVDSWTNIPCNGTNFVINKNILVGAAKSCHSQGNNKCKISVRATDLRNNVSTDCSDPLTPNACRSFSIDWTAPTVTRIVPFVAPRGESEVFSSDISDLNLTSGTGSGFGEHSCDFQISAEDSPTNYSFNGEMAISFSDPADNKKGVAKIAYAFMDAGNHYAYAHCIDLAGNESVPAGKRIFVDKRPKVSAPGITAEKYCLPIAWQGQINLGWTYKDDDGNNQTQYQFQVSTDPSFASIDIDCTHDELVLPNGEGTSALKVSTLPDNDCNNPKIGYNQTYYWRVRVKDDVVDEFGISYGGLWSNWSTPSVTISTQSHPSPFVDFLCDDNDCESTRIVENAPVTLRSTSEAAPGYSIENCKWTLPNGTNMVTGNKNSDCTITVKFPIGEDQEIKLEASDSSGYSCVLTKEINVKRPYPWWREITPFNW
ncbi:MAG: hypothetical protein PHF44_00470 [Candidatus Pacebacteria bacterium]|nr:hypothetical protein [Candidatus Paceibacterota bacterium]